MVQLKSEKGHRTARDEPELHRMANAHTDYDLRLKLWPNKGLLSLCQRMHDLEPAYPFKFTPR